MEKADPLGLDTRQVRGQVGYRMHDERGQAMAKIQSLCFVHQKKKKILIDMGIMPPSRVAFVFLNSLLSKSSFTVFVPFA